MTDTGGPVKPRFSSENSTTTKDQPVWKQSQAVVRGELAPENFLSSTEAARRVSAGARPVASNRVLAYSAAGGALSIFLVGAFLLFRADMDAPGVLSVIAAFTLTAQAAWYLRR